jgi:hypothetical protein
MAQRKKSDAARKRDSNARARSAHVAKQHANIFLWVCASLQAHDLKHVRCVPTADVLS